MAVRVRVRYWAGARAVAGVETEEFTADSVADALAQASSARGDSEEFRRVLRLSSVLVDGAAVQRSAYGDALAGDVTAEVLPPFAGGS